jgi:predicted DNA-binding transcriptional regulator AlpA
MPIDDDLFVDFRDLPKYLGGYAPSRRQLGKLMQRGLFPPAYELSPNKIAWKASSLSAWMESRPLARSASPTRITKPAPPPSSPPLYHGRGRPRGSRIVVDETGQRRLVLPSEEQAFNK